MSQFGTGQGTQDRDLLSSVLVPNNQAVVEIGMSEKNKASFDNMLTGQWLIRTVSEIRQEMKHTEATQQETCVDYLTPNMKALQSFNPSAPEFFF